MTVMPAEFAPEADRTRYNIGKIALEPLANIVRGIDWLNEKVGRAIAWLTLLMVINTFLVVMLRYVFKIGWTWFEELYIWQHAIIFMVGAGYTLLKDGHVRVDVFYRPASPQRKSLIDFIGSLLLLLPFTIQIAVNSTGWVAKSWASLEASRDAGGLPGLFLLKSVLLVFCILLGLQGLALLLRSLLNLLGYRPFMTEQGLSETGGGPEPDLVIHSSKAGEG